MADAPTTLAKVGAMKIEHPVRILAGLFVVILLVLMAYRLASPLADKANAKIYAGASKVKNAVTSQPSTASDPMSKGLN